MGDETRRDIRDIKYKIEGIDRSVDLLIRANRKLIVQDLMAFFGKSKERVRVFLAVDGEKSVNEIANELRTIPSQNVSRRLTELSQEELIRLKKTAGNLKIYEWTEKVFILKLEKELKKRFGELSQGDPGST